MHGVTVTKKSLVTCKVYSHLLIYFDPESYTDMKAEPAEHRHLMFCKLDKCRDKK